MVICLERGADCLHMVQLMSLHPKTPSSLASFKSGLVFFPFSLFSFCFRAIDEIDSCRLLNAR